MILKRIRDFVSHRWRVGRWKMQFQEAFYINFFLRTFLTFLFKTWYESEGTQFLHRPLESFWVKWVKLSIILTGIYFYGGGHKSKYFNNWIVIRIIIYPFSSWLNFFIVHLSRKNLSSDLISSSKGGTMF